MICSTDIFASLILRFTFEIVWEIKVGPKVGSKVGQKLAEKLAESWPIFGPFNWRHSKTLHLVK